jgi:DNA-binding IclR family transcriptional regulator
MNPSRGAPALARSETTYAAPALEKGLDIIELLARQQAPMTARQICEQLGRSKSELFRMISILLARGYLARAQGSDALTLSNRLFDLGLRAPQASGLMELALPVMRRLAEETGQSIYLGVPSRGESVVVACVRGGADVSYGLRLGYRRPIVNSTSGRVMLAFQDEACTRRWIEEGRALVAADFDEADLVASLARIRRDRFAVHESRDVVGLTDLGCPLLDAGGHGVAALVLLYVNRKQAPNGWAAALAALRVAAAAMSSTPGIEP